MVIRPLYVVGVAEAELFWRDVRRILFSGSRYRMLCRLGRDGVQSAWTPVKLTDVLEGVVPALRGMVDQIPELLAQVREEEPEKSAQEKMRQALTSFAIKACGHYGPTLTVENLAARGLPTAEQLACHDSFDERRRAFRSLTDDLVSQFGIEEDSVAFVHYRTDATIDAGLGPDSSSFELPEASTPSEPGEQPRYLDCELIAVYW